MCEQTPLPPQTLTDTPLFLIKITTNTIINFCLLVTQFVWKKDGAINGLMEALTLELQIGSPPSMD